jgi:acetyl/propionyl-CoA carboxylase alpha subunit
MKPSPFERILVANRGEIAVRVLRAIQEAGAEAIAVFSEADRLSKHTLIADRSLPIGPADPRESYLDIEKILQAAEDSKSQAIHPGYGFLAENAEFARRCEERGVCFIGPNAESMELLGSKREARQKARQAGVPVVPGFEGDQAEEEIFIQEAQKIGFPLLVKASAGGGGRGMRLIQKEAEFLAGLRAGKLEAEQAFGDGTMLLEKYIHPSRHIEIQVLGDGKGKAVAFPERECSVQRRHQKVVEESPSPAVSPELRLSLQEAALALVEAVKYKGAGTVEFLLDEKGAFYFLEVNTRLQVEHPVTEFVSGIDLVQAQIQLAGQVPLAELVPQRIIGPQGHAFEARVCAEDPHEGFLPSGGLLSVCAEVDAPGVRIDSGVYSGMTIPVEYDSLLAKVITHAEDRDRALSRLDFALSRCAWLGLPTNVDFLLSLIRHEAFKNGALRTDFLDVHHELLEPMEPEAPPEEVLIAAALGGILSQSRNCTSSEDANPASSAQDRNSPWNRGDSFRVLQGGSF